MLILLYSIAIQNMKVPLPLPCVSYQLKQLVAGAGAV